MLETALRDGRRLGIFLLLGPPLGMLTVIVWEVARGAPTPSLVGGVLTALPVSYLLGVLPSLATGVADAVLAPRMPGLLRAGVTGLAGGLFAAAFAAFLGASELGPGFIPWVGGLSIVPAMACSVLAGTWSRAGQGAAG
jgi:hypothetical protein